MTPESFVTMQGNVTIHKSEKKMAEVHYFLKKMLEWSPCMILRLREETTCPGFYKGMKTCTRQESTKNRTKRSRGLGDGIATGKKRKHPEQGACEPGEPGGRKLATSKNTGKSRHTAQKGKEIRAQKNV